MYLMYHPGDFTKLPNLFNFSKIASAETYCLCKQILQLNAAYTRLFDSANPLIPVKTYFAVLGVKSVISLL
jgi:hypothetical protein